NLVRHVRPVIALDERDQIFERLARQARGGRGSRWALFATVVSSRGLDVADCLDRTLAELTEPTLLGDRGFERKLGREEYLHLFRNRHTAGLVVVNGDRAVFADIDAVGAGSELKARGKLKRTLHLRMRARRESPPRRLGRGEPARELLEGRPPESLHARRAAKLLERLVRHGDELAVNVRRQVVRIGLGEIVHGPVHDLAAQRLVGFCAERLQGLELQDIAREDLVRVCDPFLDARHAEFPRPCADWRAWSGWKGWSESGCVVALARPFHPGLLWLDLVFQSRRAHQRLETL